MSEELTQPQFALSTEGGFVKIFTLRDGVALHIPLSSIPALIRGLDAIDALDRADGDSCERPAAQHHIHTWADQGPKVDIKAERNSRGYNWEIKVSGAKTTDEAIAMLAEADAKLKAQFAAPEEKPAESPAEQPKAEKAEQE